MRHSRLINEEVVTVGLKSARKKLAFGIGKAGTPPSERIVYLKLRSLAKKGCLELLDSERKGSRVRVFLPTEMKGLQTSEATTATGAPEDFFTHAGNRALILEREKGQCLYCLRALNDDNYVIEHITSRPAGDNSYRNVVAACRACNNRKGDTDARTFIRRLYREGVLDDQELQQRLLALEAVLTGQVPPAAKSI